MEERLLLVDTDIFALLAASNLLDDLAASVGFTANEIRHLPALPKQIERGRSFRRYDESSRTAILTKCDATGKWNQRPISVETFDQLTQTKGIDEGEALLFTTLMENPGYFLATGDVKSLVALGQSKELGELRNRIRGRVISLEIALLMLVHALGATVVGSRLKPFSAIHKTVDILFGTKDVFDDSETIRQVTSYLNDLRSRMGDDLLYLG